MITLLNTNFGRCGSTSLWVFFNKHPQIISSKIKEPLNIKGVKKSYFTKKYYNHWDGFQDDNIYLDGTPQLFVRHYDLIKSTFFDRFCSICILRNHIDYIISRMVFQDSTRSLKEKHNLFSQDLDVLSKKIGRENIFIVDLKNIEKKQKEIYKFLNVDQTCFFKFPYLNSSFGKKIEIIRLKKYLYYKKIVLENLDIIEPLIKKDKQQLQEKYGIGDLE